MISYFRLAVCGSFVALAAILLSNRAAAQVDPWEFEVYPYATEGRGVAELETDNAVVTNGHSRGGNGTAAGTFPSQAMWYNQYELTYGLTDRIEAAAYLNLALPRGGGYQYASSKYRLRGRLFDEDVLPVNLGWYVELEWHRTPQFDDVPLELELRPTIEKDIGRFSILANPIFEKPIFIGPDKNRASSSATPARSTTVGRAISRRGSKSTARQPTWTTPHPCICSSTIFFRSSGANYRIGSNTTSDRASASRAAPTA